MIKSNMFIISLIISCLCFVPANSNSEELSYFQVASFSKMISKNYCFASYKDGQFELINKNKSKSITAQHFFNGSKGICKSKWFSKKMKKVFAQTIAKRYETKHQILIRKKNKFYSFANGKVKELEIDFIENIIREDNREQFTETKRDLLLKINQCKYCQTNLAGNYVSVESSSQFNFEFGWAPYYKISNRQGIVGHLALSSYTLEDDNLEKSRSLIYKMQVLWRVYFDHLFLEAGLGQHYIDMYEDWSLMQTFGAGYVYKTRQWFLIKEFGLGGYYLRASKVNWRLNIMEYQLGFLINF